MSSSTPLSPVAAIIVTYEPVEEEISLLIEALAPQVETLYLIDNGSTNGVPQSLSHPKLKAQLLSNNVGIAKAQNIGLEKAIDEGFDHFILFDQDSIPADDMVEQLLACEQDAIQAGYNVAAIGPTHIDKDSHEENYYIRSGKWKVNKASVPHDSPYQACDFIIASGCLISLTSLNHIGFMEEDLFIDCVDIEWGFRACSKGYDSFFTSKAKMWHKVGDEPIHLFGKALTIHSPIRHYYYFRNFYTLLQRNYVPLSWKIHTFVKSSIQAVIFSLFLDDKKAQRKAISRGIFDGIKQRLGQKTNI